jgi:BirA family biotin operon repressor/biotin-[acetyl-CoA-carboxylase] ligase
MTFYDAESLSEALAPRPVRFYQQVDSTNNLARAWLRDGAVPGAAVIADAQTRGRGRRGHGWVTPPGEAIAISVILKPKNDDLMRLSMLGALAIAEMAQAIGLDAVGIKWPNDVLISGRKVSGVLPEAEWQGDRLLGAVLGIGINVRVNFTGTELADKAISLETATGRPLDRVELLKLLLERMDYWFRRLDSDALLDRWKVLLLTIGQDVRVEALVGRAEAVDEVGALMVRSHDGQLHRVVAGDLVSR